MRNSLKRGLLVLAVLLVSSVAAADPRHAVPTVARSKPAVAPDLAPDAQLAIVHRNDMGGFFKLIRVVYFLDGAEIFSRLDAEQGLGKDLLVFKQPITPGPHTVSVVLVYRGSDFGIFSYLKGYQTTVRGSKTFTFPEGQDTQLNVVGFEKGNPLTSDFKDRPAISFRIHVASALTTWR